MKLDPGFVNHWKTERLIDQLGADGVVAVLRLWGNAQIGRKFAGLPLSPKRLAMETKWKGDEGLLFSVLTDTDAPWLDEEPGGTFTIHGFAEHQHQVVKLWENGKLGGRPKGAASKSSSSTSSSTSSSSYPICEPNGNHMVSAGKGSKKADASKAEEIYQAYPRHIAHKPAIAAILKAMSNHPSEHLLAKVMAYAAAVKGSDPKFIPHPATWFNAERFDDDPTEWANPSTSKAPNKPTSANDYKLS
jgi:hypothetical protein